MGNQVNFVVTQPKFSLRHYISVADNDARFIIVIASDWLLIVVLYLFIVVQSCVEKWRPFEGPIPAYLKFEQLYEQF